MRKFGFLIFLVFLSPAKGEEFFIEDLSGGMYSNASANTIPDNAAVHIQNFFTDVEPLVNERNGYEKRDTTILGGTSAVPGLWEFVDNLGNNWAISFSSRTFYKNLLGDTPTVFGQLQTVDTFPNCAVNLGKLWCVDGTDALWWFDGTSTGSVASAPLGRLVIPWRNRVVIGNIAGSQSTLRFSADGDGLTWTLGTTETDPFSLEFGGANDGYNITCLWSSYYDNLIVARKRDIWAVSGFDAGDVITRNISKEIGCIQDGTMREFDGSLLFMSDRGMEEMRGTTIKLISEPIRNITDVIVKNTSSVRRNEQTSKADFDAGTTEPTGYLTTEISNGSIELATAAAVSSFVDTSDSDYIAGTLTNLSTAIVSGMLILSTDVSHNTLNFTTSNGTPVCTTTGTYDMAQRFSFVPGGGSGYILSKVDLRLSQNSSGSNASELKILSNNSGVPGDVLYTFSGTNIAATSAVEETVTFYGSHQFALDSGTNYWLKLEQSNGAGCSGNYINWYQSTSPIDSGDDSIAVGNSVLSSGNEFAYVLYYKQFASTGNFVSQTFDVGAASTTFLNNWGTLQSTISYTASSTATLTFETQVATATDGLFTSWVTVATGSSISSFPNYRYIRYKVSVQNADRKGSPRIESVTLNNGVRLRPTAYYRSQIYETSEDITAWGTVTINDNVSQGSIAYEIASCTATNQAACTAFSSLSSGQVPTVTTAAYAVFGATFTAVIATDTVRLNSFQTSWEEGAGLQPIKSWVYDRRYWLAYTTNVVSGAFNNNVLVYQRNRTWTILSGINALSFAIWQDALYFGNSNDTGYVYKYDVGNDDDGSNIHSTVLFKSYDLESAVKEKVFDSLYASFLGDDSFVGDFSLSYSLDRDDNDYSLGTADLSESNGQVNAKFPFPLSNPVRGREIQLFLSKNGVGDRLKLYGFNTIFTYKEEN